ncbi:hypothetical protein GE107_16285 [Cohnella sp. CFH 77786]|uniref:hypothetical protein n=1 Tax=Cohnella sp. CFH 77786 TaxID=2662265 RepID=UPI001C60E0A6|nr:hypothetical protein [Cohnella sp. CFH 77786]MBW5447617.1 hypothetical protein [Cohnella sp. CFH 77786]
MTLQKKLLLTLSTISIILIAAGAFVLLYNFPKTIDIEYPAIEYLEDDPLTAQATTIRIQGTLSRPLFRNATFHGKFIIDKYDFTKTYWLMDVVMRNGWGWLTYANTTNGDTTLQSLGSIWMSGDFDKLKIVVHEPVSGEYTKPSVIRISAPAKNYYEALSIDQINKE